MRTKIPLIVFLLLLQYSMGRSEGVDSLRSGLSNATSSEDSASIALQLGSHYLYYQPDSSAYFLSIAVSALPPTGMDSIYILTYEKLGSLKEVQGQFQDAVDLIYPAWKRVQASHRDSDLDQIYTLLGRFHMRLTHYDSAVFYWNKILERKQQKGDEYGQWVAYHYLASMYDDLNNWPKAKTYYLQAMEKARLEKRPKDYPYLMFLFMNACKTNNEPDLYSQIRNEYLAFKLTQGQTLLSSEHSNMMRIEQSPALQRAELLKYLPYHVRHKNYYSACDAWYRIGQTYMEEKKYDDAIASLQQMLPYLDSIHMTALSHNGHVEMYKAYLAKNDYKHALEHYQIVYALRDTILNTERQALMDELTVKYETAEKEKQLAETSLTLDRSRKKQQFLGLGMLIAVLVAAFAYNAFRTKARSNRILEEKNKIIADALAEKDILLREIHHRVKNNLQMISALLYLHGKSVDDTSAQEALLESQNRVQSMAMIHQNLYQNENLLGISIKQYMDKLLSHLISAYNIEKDRISVVKKIDIPNLDVDTVIPLALIINELLSNALKYAFRDGRQGEIQIIMREQGHGLYVLVSDNGMGLPPPFSLQTSSSFGMKLINILCERLGATWTTHQGAGTSISIEIPSKIAA